MQKEPTHKPFLIAVPKNLFSSVFVIGKIDKLASINHSISFDSWKTMFFINVYRYCEVPSSKLFEISLYFIFCLHNTNTKVKVQCKRQSSKMKLSHFILKTLNIEVEIAFDHSY